MTEESKAPVFDRDGALDRVDQDLELFGELINLFFEDYPSSLTAIEDAIKSLDGKKLMESAHSIKSALGNLGAMRAFETAYALERMGRDGDLKEASAHLEQLKNHVDAFKNETSDFQ